MTDTFRKEYSSNHDLHILALEMKSTAEHIEEFYNKIPQGREMSIARTKLEESIMWATKAIFSFNTREAV